MPNRPPKHRPPRLSGPPPDDRPSAARRGYGARWQRYREWFLTQHRLCAECWSQGRLTEATVVDHIEPHRGDYEKFWRPENHQSLCLPCHQAKTARGE